MHIESSNSDALQIAQAQVAGKGKQELEFFLIPLVIRLLSGRMWHKHSV